MCVIGIAVIAIALWPNKPIIPPIEASIGGVILFIVGVFIYFRSRISGIEIKALGETLSVDAPTGRGEGYDFVSKMLQEMSSQSK